MVVDLIFSQKRAAAPAIKNGPFGPFLFLRDRHESVVMAAFAMDVAV